LVQTASLTGWVTPASRDWKDTPGMATEGKNPDGSTRKRMDMLPRQAHGTVTPLLPAQTEIRGVLNPNHSRWLQAYPPRHGQLSPGWSSWDLVQKTLRELCERQGEIG